MSIAQLLGKSYQEPRLSSLELPTSRTSLEIQKWQKQPMDSADIELVANERRLPGKVLQTQSIATTYLLVGNDSNSSAPVDFECFLH